MTLRRKRLGELGEKVASSYLEEIGYRIIDRNVRMQAGEIDLVAEKDEVLYFVEVKSRLKSDFRDGYSTKQRERLNNLALVYLSKHNLEKQVSFLIVGVMFDQGNESKYVVEIVEDPFV